MHSVGVSEAPSGIDMPHGLLKRWDTEKYYAAEAVGGLTMYVRAAAFAPGLDAFDADLFRYMQCL